MAKQTAEVMVQDRETVAKRRASLPVTTSTDIKQLSVVGVPKLTAMTPHLPNMPIGDAMSLPPTTIEVSGQAVRSGSSKTLHLVTHLRRRVSILWASRG